MMKNYVKHWALKHVALNLTLAATLGAYSQHAVATEPVAPASGGAVATSTTGTPAAVSEDQAPQPISKKHPITADKVTAQQKHIAGATHFSPSPAAEIELLGVFDKLQLSAEFMQKLKSGKPFSLPGIKNIKFVYYIGDNGAPVMTGFPSLSSPYVMMMGSTPYITSFSSAVDGLSCPGGSLLVTSITGIQQTGTTFTLDPIGTISKPTTMVLVVYNYTYPRGDITATLPSLTFLAMMGE